MEIDQNRLYDLPELLTKNGGPLPLSRTGIYAAAKRGEIPSVKIGNRVFIPGRYIHDLVAGPVQ